MTAPAKPEQNESDGLDIDLNGSTLQADTLSSASTVPNVHLSSVSCEQLNYQENRGQQPSSPLKEVTNITANSFPRISNPTSTLRQQLSSITTSFRVPPPQGIKTSPDREKIPILAPGTPQSPIEVNTAPKRRRWSSIAQSPRRNSFPSTRKDTLDNVHAVRTEAKSARERGPPTLVVSKPGSTTRKRKDSSPITCFNGPVHTTGIDGNGYFTPKLNPLDSPNLRARSSTIPSGSVPFGSRHGPHTGGAANVSPRIKHIRHESLSSHAEVLPTTLWDYLLLEMGNSEIQGVEDYKKERLSNFLRIPESFEKVCSI